MAYHNNAVMITTCFFYPEIIWFIIIFFLIHGSVHTLFTNVVCELVKINDCDTQHYKRSKNLNTRKLLSEVYALMCFICVTVVSENCLLFS